MSDKIIATVTVEAERLDQVVELLELTARLAHAGICDAGGRQGQRAGYEFKMIWPEQAETPSNGRMRALG